MRKKVLGFVFAAVLMIALAVPLFGAGGTAEAHNVGHLISPVQCVDVGGGNHPPEAGPNSGHARGVNHASHAGQNQSAVHLGSCE